MVTRRQTASQDEGGAASKGGNNDQNAKVTNDFISKLAGALQRRGKRTWKEKEVTKALEKAISALPDTPLKTSLQTSLPAAAAQLLEHLRPEEPAVPKPRAKRAKTTREAAKEEPAVPAAPSAPTILDSSLEAAVEAILNGESPSNIDAIGALVSRFPPPQGLLEWQLLKMYPAASGDAPNLDTLLTAAEKALQACNALAGQAALREEALATFQPALSMMLRAARVLEQSGSQTASGDAEHLAQWQTLKMLSSRALVCMDLVGKEINAVNGASDGGAPADQASRWWLRRIVTENGSVHDALAAARTACAAAVSLCTSTQLCELGSEGRVESLAALAGHSMRVLAPYAAAGQMAAGAETNAEDVGEPREGAILFVALYLAAAEQTLPNLEFYFQHMLAARNAAAVATSLGNSPLAAKVLSSAAGVVPPPSALEWLRDQPPSSVILQALESLQQGPQGLSSHLIYSASERAVKALASAAKAGGVLAGDGTAPGAGGAEDEPSPADDLLFFVSKEGDGGAFGLDWASDGEGSDEVGIDLDELPEEGQDRGVSASGSEDLADTEPMSDVDDE